VNFYYLCSPCAIVRNISTEAKEKFPVNTLVHLQETTLHLGENVAKLRPSPIMHCFYSR
jgi:hypothetical protein